MDPRERSLHVIALGLLSLLLYTESERNLLAHSVEVFTVGLRQPTSQQQLFQNSPMSHLETRRKDQVLDSDPIKAT